MVLFFYTEWFDEHDGELPTVQEMLDVWTNCSLNDLEKEENKKIREFIIWYWDRWLPIAAGRAYWDEKHRYYELPTSMMDVAGEKKVHVTITSEAFALLVYHNNRDKWIAFWEHKKAHGKKAPIPTKGEAAKAHQAKFTNSKCGQVKFGGWSEEAYEFFEEYKTKLQAERKGDKEAQYTQFRAALKLVRDAKGIEATSPNNKKRRRKPTADEGESPKAKKVTINLLDE